MNGGGRLTLYWPKFGVGGYTVGGISTREYSRTTNKPLDQDNIQQKLSSSDELEEVVEARSSRSSIPATNFACCIICQGNKTVKGESTYELLTNL